MPFDIDEGLELAARLKLAGGRVGAKGALVLRKTVADVVADAKAFAPVDTGYLRSSIYGEVEGDGRSKVMSAVIGAEAYYAVYQEFGTSTQPGTPFLRPALERRVPLFEAAMAQLAETELL